MDTFEALLAILTGIVLRFVLPIGITMLAIYFLRKLDARWQAEGQMVAETSSVEKPKCWEVNNCPPEKVEKCPGYLSAQPCWQAFRTREGYLKEECLECSVFRNAPIPAHQTI